MSKVWIIVADDMSAAKVAGVAASTNEEVEAVVLGSRERAEHVATLGVSTVFWYDTTNTLAESYAGAIADAALAAEVDAIVAADEAVARVITGCIAAKGNVLITSNVNALRVEGDQVTIERGVAEGSSIQTLKAQRPAIALIGESVDEIDPGNEPASIQQIEVSVPDALTAGDYHAPEDSGINLAEAQRVVSCGLGIGGKENLALMDELAEVLEAEVACSLPLCDNYHWFEHSRVVGSSTQKISPRFYLACGVSGAPNHMMGVRGAKLIMAINKDPEAPIFRESKYGIVGDVKEVLPALIAALKTA